MSVNCARDRPARKARYASKSMHRDADMDAFETDNCGRSDRTEEVIVVLLTSTDDGSDVHSRIGSERDALPLLSVTRIGACGLPLRGESVHVECASSNRSRTVLNSRSLRKSLEVGLMSSRSTRRLLGG